MEKYHYEDGLGSARLQTRFLKIQDASLWSEFFETPETLSFIQDFEPAHSLLHATVWIERQLLRYENKLFGLQALCDRNIKEFIGMCGLITQEVDGLKELEIGYHLLKRHWGKGYASEAALLFKEYAQKNNLNKSVVSIIHIHNLRSQKVAVTNGMSLEKQTQWREKDVFVYRVNI